MKPFLRFEVMEANAYVQEEFIKSGFDVLDIHYHLMLQIHRSVHNNYVFVLILINLLLDLVLQSAFGVFLVYVHPL